MTERQYYLIEKRPKYKTIHINLAQAHCNQVDYELNRLYVTGWRVKQVLYYDNTKATILMERIPKRWWQFWI